MNLRNYIIVILFAFAAAGCAAKKMAIEDIGDVPELTPIKIGAGVTMQTDSDVSWRRYSFKDVPLTFMFTDSISPVLTYGDNYSVKLADIFYTPALAVKNARTIGLNHQWNLDYFTTNQLRSTITAAYFATMNGRRYVVCSFTKNQLNTLPYEDNINYLIDITEKHNIKAIAFPDVANTDGGANDVAEDILPVNGYLAVRFTFYSNLQPYELSTRIITQNEQWEWVME